MKKTYNDPMIEIIKYNEDVLVDSEEVSVNSGVKDDHCVSGNNDLSGMQNID